MSRTERSLTQQTPIANMNIDRLSIRGRPAGVPIMHQTWSKLLFMHWRVREEDLRPRIPGDLQIDTHDGSAWIGVTPFTMPRIRPPLVPALPVVGSSHEINVRTYVHHDGIPGVWFFSLDASNPLAVAGARLGFSLPYFRARMRLEEDDGQIRFESFRRHPGAPYAEFKASWRLGEELPIGEPDSLKFFLTERYCLYATRGRDLVRCRIHHEPWPLRSARLLSLTSSMIESHGIPAPEGEPLLHSQAAPLDVEIWPPRKV